CRGGWTSVGQSTPAHPTPATWCGRRGRRSPRCGRPRRRLRAGRSESRRSSAGRTPMNPRDGGGESVAKRLRITYRRSVIGRPEDQKKTIRSLGLRKLNSTVEQPDTPTIRGMIAKVRHLVDVEEVDA